MLKVDLASSQKIKNAISQMNVKSEKHLQKFIADAAFTTQTNAVKSIQASASSGAVYKRRSIEHTASLPNNPPNSDTGNLVRNITVGDVAGGKDVGSRSGAPYGLWLEFGTRNTAPRPWLRPAFEAMLKIIVPKYTQDGFKK